jgi:hypothetical protein
LVHAFECVYCLTPLKNAPYDSTQYNQSLSRPKSE